MSSVKPSCGVIVPLIMPATPDMIGNFMSKMRGLTWQVVGQGNIGLNVSMIILRNSLDTHKSDKSYITSIARRDTHT